jgi:hypothetical protein
MAFQSPLDTESESLRDLPEWSRSLRVVRKARYVTCRLMSRDRALPCKNSSEQRIGKIHDKERLLQRTNSVATTVARPYTSGLLLVGICERRCLRPPPLPTTLPYLRARITGTITQVDAEMGWNSGRWDICLVTRGSHVEDLWLKLDLCCIIGYDWL